MCKLSQAICCLTILVLFGGIATACTGIYGYQEGLALAGNNEDYWNPNIKIWFVPAERGAYGRVCFGYENLTPQGGMNEKGLFFDGFATKRVPVRNSHGKKQIEANLLDKVLAECATVPEVIAVYEQYDLAFLENAMLFYADKHGRSVIIEGDAFVKKKGRYQIVTNFYQSHSSPDEYTCSRYKKADALLGNCDEISVELFRDILKATHAEGPSYTLYSNICDLTKGTIYLYHFHDFDKPVVLQLSDELKKGNRILDIPTLFSKNDKWTKFEEESQRQLERRQDELRSDKIDSKVYRRYVGRYIVAQPGIRMVIDIERKGDKLFAMVRDQPHVEIIPKSLDTFFRLDHFGMTTLTFVRGKDRTVEQLVVERQGRKFVAQRQGG